MMCRNGLWVILLLLPVESRRHPPVLTHLKSGLVVGGLAYHETGRRLPRSLAASSHQGDHTTAVGLGVYLLTVNVNGFNLSGVIDTGSGVNQVACRGVQSQPGYPVRAIDPRDARPALGAVACGSAACTSFCDASCVDCGTKCLLPPQAAPGTCEYYTHYLDGSYVYGRLYAGQLSFSPTASPATKPLGTLSPFYFGCSYKASTNPYFYGGDASVVFGLDWEDRSLWGQLMRSHLVGDTMYLCLGDGGEVAGRDERGVIVFGKDKAVSIHNRSVGGEVVTLKMLNPYDKKNQLGSRGQRKVNLPSMWVTLTAVGLGAPHSYDASGNVYTGLGSVSPEVYLIDSGSSYVSLLADAWYTVQGIFCPTINSPAANYSQVAYCNDTDAENNGFVLTTYKAYSWAELDALLPPILFAFKTGSAPVRFKPSNYMIYLPPSSNSGVANQYAVAIYPTSSTTGTLGNSWMTQWLFQQQQSTRELKMTQVVSCDDIIY